MAEVTYIARRRLAPNHFAGTTYSLPLSILGDLQRPTGGDLKQVQTSLSGKRETLYFGRDRIWRVPLEPIAIPDADLVYEFLESTADGQLFSFDPYGNSEMPGLPLIVMRSDSGYEETASIRQGLGGLTDYVRLAFEVVEQ